jgi:anthranilate phosphoribosyltransferase
VHAQAQNIVDTCGTGGDSIKTFNISTAAAIIASASGVTIAKHGNRAVTSKCGSADVLEALGVRLSQSPEQAAAMLDAIGIAFLFAPGYHPAMKHAAAPRKELGFRTVFNLVGPLTNPAGATRQLVGVNSPQHVPKIARTLKRLNAERAVVAHGLIGLDEVSPIGATKIAVLNCGNIEELEIHAVQFDIAEPSLEEIAAGETVQQNAQKLLRSISDPESAEARAAIPSASVAIWLSGAASNLFEGAETAKNAIARGEAKKRLERLIEMSGGGS